MTGLHLPALGPFLRLLASLPSPAIVVPALVHGPLAAFGATAGSIVRLVGDELLTLASDGYPTDELARYRAIPMRGHLPFVLAVQQGMPVATSLRTLLDEYPLLEIDAGMWTSLLADLPDGVLMSVPIALDGTAVGAYGFLAADPAAASVDAQPALLGLSAALGLWLTHPSRPAPPDLPRSWSPGLALTPRQASILQGVERGLGNASIALELGCSRDTVKADLQRALRVLGVSTRQEAVARASAARAAVVRGRRRISSNVMTTGAGVDRVVVISPHPSAVARLLPMLTAAGLTVDVWSAPGSRLGYSRHPRRCATLPDDLEQRHAILATIADSVGPGDWVILGSDADVWDVLAAAEHHPRALALLPVPAAHLDAVGTKTGMAALLRDLGVDQPRWTVAPSPGDLPHAAATLGYPVIVKADRSGAGAGTTVLRSPGDVVVPRRGNEGPYLVEELVDGFLVSIDILVSDGRVATAPYSRVLRSLGPYGVSVTRQFVPLTDRRLLADLDRIAAALGGRWFGNLSAIRRPNGTHAVFEVDLRPNVWHAYQHRLGYPLLPALRAIRAGEPLPAPGSGPAPTTTTNLSRTIMGAIQTDPRLAAELLSVRRTWRHAHRGDARLTYREARDLARWLALTRGGRLPLRG